MQISSIPPVQATSPVERHVAAQGQSKTQVPDGSVAPAGQATPVPRGVVPAPGLRPNVQDCVDIDRTLIALRRG